jgi:hypothetical protein
MAPCQPFLLSPLSGAHMSLNRGCPSSPSYPGHGCRPPLSTLLSPVCLPGHPLRWRRPSSPVHPTTTAKWEGLLRGASSGTPPPHLHGVNGGQWIACATATKRKEESGPAPATREEESSALALPAIVLLLLYRCCRGPQRIDDSEVPLPAHTRSSACRLTEKFCALHGHRLLSLAFALSRLHTTRLLVVLDGPTKSAMSSSSSQPSPWPLLRCAAGVGLSSGSGVCARATPLLPAPSVGAPHSHLVPFSSRSPTARCRALPAPPPPWPPVGSSFLPHSLWSVCPPALLSGAGGEKEER